jgi:pimeloyl-ACP methyl ester carboxylesterase
MFDFLRWEDGATDHVEFDDVAVEYEVTGSGDQVVLLHARPFVGWYAPLVDVLSEYSVLRCRRTVPLDGRPFSIDDDAAVCARLLRHVAFDRPHVVGHSYGALVTLALARSDVVPLRSIALLEPAGSGLQDPEQATAGLAPLMELYRTQGSAVAAEQFLGAVLGDDARSLLERCVPGAFDDALANADQFFQVELPAAAQWRFGEDDARLIEQPILNVIGAETLPRFVQSAAIVQSLFPAAVRVELPGVGHLLMAQEPTEMATRLAEFWR